MQMLWIYQAHALYIRNLLFVHIYIHPLHMPPLGPELLSDTLSLQKMTTDARPLLGQNNYWWRDNRESWLEEVLQLNKFSDKPSLILIAWHAVGRFHFPRPVSEQLWLDLWP